MSSALFLLAILFFFFSSMKIIWTVYFHPLRNLPGPKMWIAFPINRFISLSRGQLDVKMRDFHKAYGEVVRFGPNEVSFITVQAWKDIYGHGHRQLPKVLHSTSNPSDIVSANDADHSRLRRSLAHAFSTKGLQSQEPVINKYVDLLIEKLKILGASPVPEADMVKWYNLTAFDILGDLAFGEPFGGLESCGYHYWVSTIFQAIRAVALVQFKDAYPLLFRILSLFVGSKRLMNARQRQIEFSRATVQKRLQIEGHRECTDFIGSMLRHRGEPSKEITDEELEANSNVLAIAGSGTTSSLLSGVTYWLLKTPHAMEEVTREIRSAMKSERDITISSTANLPYMLACLKEAFRMYPPAPSGQQRMTLGPEPTQISGHFMPPNTNVSVHQYAAYRSPMNFYAPDQFLPERWLENARSNRCSPFYNDHRDVLQPFSVGPRNCIGRELAYSELRVILTRVLWNFDLELHENSRQWDIQPSYIAWEKPPLMCTLRMSGKEISRAAREN